MKTISMEQHGDISVVTLNNGTTNAVCPALVDDLDKTLDLAAEQSRGLVLCGGSRFFCIGLDLPELLTLKRPDMTTFWYAFNRMVMKLYTLPMPTACAVEGHGPAAGTILALACDFRICADQKALLGLNEIQIGLNVPYIAALMLRQILSQADTDELLYNGLMIPPEKAGQIGLATELFPKDEVKDQAVKKIQSIAQFSAPAFAATKAVKTEHILNAFEKNEKEQNECLLDIWFSKETQKALNQALKNF